METGAVEIVRRQRSTGVDGCGVGEVERLFIRVFKKRYRDGEGGAYVEMSILEASPDTIACFDLDRRKAGSLRNLGINDGFSPQTRELRSQA